jgi:4-hydroxybenzoate polyprenyltransferase
MASRAAFRAGDAAHGYPGWGPLGLVVVCMVAARSAAMTFNRLADAVIDARNPRTAGRPIPAGTITRGQAIVFLAAAVTVFILGCAGFYWLAGNPWPVMLSVPVLTYLCLYSYAKRFTRWSHFILGSAIAFSPVAAWLAIHPASVGAPALLLMGAVTFWIGGFDIIYACQDLEIDRAQGLFSLPSRLGPAKALWIARAAHAGTVFMLAALIPVAGLGWLYAAGVIVVAALLVVENALVRPDDFSRVNVAFFTVNGVISLLLGVLTIADCLVRPSLVS